MKRIIVPEVSNNTVFVAIIENNLFQTDFDKLISHETQCFKGRCHKNDESTVI